MVIRLLPVVGYIGFACLVFVGVAWQLRHGQAYPVWPIPGPFNFFRGIRPNFRFTQPRPFWISVTTQLLIGASALVQGTVELVGLLSRGTP
jgi:hypothetical protein